MPIDLHVDDAGIATITINRPDRMNALDTAHYRDLSRVWIEVRGMRLEQMMSHALQISEDVQEGRAAFLEKRTPRFRGK
jgi:enoyl-CoA hydratase/carnithine racemase